MKYNKKYKTASKKKNQIHLSYRSKRRIKTAVKYGLVLTIGLFIGSAFVGSSTPSADGDTFLDKVSAAVDQVKTGLNTPSTYKYSVDVLSIKPDSIDGLETVYKYYEGIGNISTGRTEIKVDISDIELQISNNRDESITLDFVHHGIVYDDGSQENVFRDSFNFNVPSKYMYSNFLKNGEQFTLLPNANKVFHIPFNKIDRNRDPKLIIAYIENPTSLAKTYGDEMSRGKRNGDTKEFIIPLAPYL